MTQTKKYQRRSGRGTVILERRWSAQPYQTHWMWALLQHSSSPFSSHVHCNLCKSRKNDGLSWMSQNDGSHTVNQIIPIIEVENSDKIRTTSFWLSRSSELYICWSWTLHFLWLLEVCLLRPWLLPLFRRGLPHWRRKYNGMWSQDPQSLINVHVVDNHISPPYYSCW